MYKDSFFNVVMRVIMNF